MFAVRPAASAHRAVGTRKRITTLLNMLAPGTRRAPGLAGFSDQPNNVTSATETTDTTLRSPPTSLYHNKVRNTRISNNLI